MESAFGQGSPEGGKVAVTPSLVLGAMSNGGGGKVGESSAVDLSDEYENWRPHPSFPSRRRRSSVSSSSSSASASSSPAVGPSRPPPPSRPSRRSPSPHVSQSSSSRASSKVASSSSHRSSSASSNGSSNVATSGRQQSPPPSMSPRNPSPPLAVPTLGRSRSNSAASRFNPDTTIPSIFVPPFSSGSGSGSGGEGTPPTFSPPQRTAPVLKSPRPMPASLPSFLAEFEEGLDPSTAASGAVTLAPSSSLFGSLGGAAEKLEDEEEGSGGGGVSINLTTPNETITSIHSPSPPPLPLSNGRDRSSPDSQFLVHPLFSSSQGIDASPSAPVTSSSDSNSPLDLEDPRDALKRKREAKAQASSRTPSPVSPLPPSSGTFFGQEELEREQDEIASFEAPRPRLFGHGLTESDEEDAGEHAEGMWKATVVQPVDSDSSRDDGEGEGEEGSSEDDEAGAGGSTPRHQHHAENHTIDPDEGVEICNSPEDTDEYDLPSPSSPPSSSGQNNLPRSRPPHPSYLSPSSSSSSSSSNSSTSAPTLLADAPSFFPPQNGPSPPPLGAEEDMMGGPGEEAGFGGGQEGFLPAVADMDLEDESLTTLERIFLLSKSEFTHHR